MLFHFAIDRAQSVTIRAVAGLSFRPKEAGQGVKVNEVCLESENVALEDLPVIKQIVDTEVVPFLDSLRVGLFRDPILYEIQLVVFRQGCEFVY